jgi:hypothetical protein
MMKGRGYRMPLFGIAILIVLITLITSAFGADQKTNAPKGYVSFYSAGDLELSIAPVVEGKELESQTNTSFFRGVITDYRIEAAPGEREFIIRHGETYKQTFRVTVKDKAVTYIGLRRQIIGSQTSNVPGTYGGTSKRTMTSFYLRSTVGKHPLPADENTKDPVPYIEALKDSDWATRLNALMSLLRIRPVLSQQTVGDIQVIAREDMDSGVRGAATKLLEKMDYKLLAKPLYLETFEDNSAKWSSNTKDEIMGFSEEGYFIEPETERYWWTTVGVSDSMKKRSDFDAVVDCSWRKGASNFPYGLILGKDKEEFYGFGISRNGGAVVHRWSGNSIKSTPIPWKYDAAKTIGENLFSRVQISKRGDTYTFRINGVTVGSFTDKDKLPVQSIGVFAANKQSVIFKKIIVLEP